MNYLAYKIVIAFQNLIVILFLRDSQDFNEVWEQKAIHLVRTYPNEERRL